LALARKSSHSEIVIWRKSFSDINCFFVKEAYLEITYLAGKNGQNDHLKPEQKDHPLAGAN
jgi:hypothetical protein